MKTKLLILLLTLKINTITTNFKYYKNNQGQNYKKAIEYSDQNFKRVNYNKNYQNLYQNQNYLGNIVSISKPILTTRMISKPFVAQRLISQPIIRRKIIQQPIVTKRIIKKKIYKTVQNEKPNIKEKVIRKKFDVRVPAKEINNLTIIKRKIHTNNVNVKFNKLPQIRIYKKKKILPIKIKNERRIKIIKTPGQINYHHTIIKPTIHTIKEKLNLIQNAPKIINHKPITKNLIIKNKFRTQNVKIPSNEIHNKTIIKPILRRERVKIEYIKKPDVVINKKDIYEEEKKKFMMRTRNVRVPPQKTVIQPIIQNIIRERETHHIHKPLFKKYHITKTVTVPTNIIQKVEVLKKVKVPVKTKGKVSVVRGKEFWDKDFKYKSYLLRNGEVESSESEESDGFVTMIGDERG